MDEIFRAVLQLYSDDTIQRAQRQCNAKLLKQAILHTVAPALCASGKGRLNFIYFCNFHISVYPGTIDESMLS